MSTASDLFWLRVQRRASTLAPDVARALLRALAIIRDQLSTRQVQEWIATGNVDAVIRAALSDTILDQAFAPLRQQIYKTTADAVPYFARDIPKGLMAAGTAGIAFNVLSPDVIAAITALDTKVIQGLKDGVREVVRAYLENGLRDGVGPRVTAAGLREIIGLSPGQLDAVASYGAALRGGARETVMQKALDMLLRDRRFDPTVAAAKEGGYSLSKSQIDKMTAAYQRKMVALNAETVSRTATLDSLKLGQRMSWEDAQAKGLLGDGVLMKTWRGVLDDREREEHVAMEGETVPADEPYSNGEDVPGESTYNCRCVSVYHVARAGD